MAHCGYEATAVEDMLKNPLKALYVSLRGPKTSGAMAPEPTPEYNEAKYTGIENIAVKVEAVE
jgi:hypothetical protein